MRVPYLDLKLHHRPLHDEIMQAVGQVIDDCAFAGGPYVETFETAFATHCGTAFAIGVGSGSEALWLALRALDVGVGDEVITVPNTFAATAEAICLAGARPVFVDIDPATRNLDPGRLEAAITPRTRAVIPVHLFGRPADMPSILDITRAHQLAVVEDGAQAHGAAVAGQMVGSLGDAGCFSFYPGKNLGAWGDAGAIVTSDPALSRRVRELRDHGQVERCRHVRLGWNCRMDGMQAAVLTTKLAYLDQANQSRRNHVASYRTLLADVPGIRVPPEDDSARGVYHIFAIEATNRDGLLSFLADQDIDCRIHYPVPLHLQPAFAHLGYGPGSFPVAEASAARLLSLPIYPELTAEQVRYVADRIRAFADKADHSLAAEPLCRR